MRQGPRWSANEGGPLSHAAGDPGGPEAKEAASPMRQGPHWSPNEGGLLTHAAEASVVPK